MKKYLILFFILFFLITLQTVSAQENVICAVYITGIGCSNCAVTDPFVLSELFLKYPNLLVVEYELYHQYASNEKIVNQYFENYIPIGRTGIPLLIFDKEKTALGRYLILEVEDIISAVEANRFPMPDGLSVEFETLDLNSLPGKIKIWTKDRVLISNGEKHGSALPKTLLLTKDLDEALKDVEFEKIIAEPIKISKGEIDFSDAIQIGGWILQWNGETRRILDGISPVPSPKKGAFYWIIGLGFFLGVLFLFYLLFLRKRICFCLTEKHKSLLIAGVSAAILIVLFILARYISPTSLKELGYNLPLPVFTFFLALVDGFNPCNLFVLTLLLGLLISVSKVRKKIYAVGYSFIFVVFVIYFLFMAAWLNIFKFIGFITPLRVTIALIAIIAGLINCKELFFFRKGVTLMIQEGHKKPLLNKIDQMKKVIKTGSMPALILASVILAAFASLVELPCTAGFPIIYTAILSGKMLASSWGYYLYLLFYNLIYVLPLIVMITIFGWTLKGKKITKQHMQIIKFIGGLIMILLGIILIVNPGLISVGM